MNGYLQPAEAAPVCSVKKTITGLNVLLAPLQPIHLQISRINKANAGRGRREAVRAEISKP